MKKMFGGISLSKSSDTVSYLFDVCYRKLDIVINPSPRPWSFSPQIWSSVSVFLNLCVAGLFLIYWNRGKILSLHCFCSRISSSCGCIQIVGSCLLSGSSLPLCIQIIALCFKSGSFLCFVSGSSRCVSGSPLFIFESGSSIYGFVSGPFLFVFEFGPSLCFVSGSPLFNVNRIVDLWIFIRLLPVLVSGSFLCKETTETRVPSDSVEVIRRKKYGRYIDLS